MFPSWFGDLIVAAEPPKAQPGPKSVSDYLDAVNNWLQGLSFETAIRDPKFWAISVVFLALCMFRGWKGMVITYVLGIAIWGIVHHTVLKDQMAAADSTGNVMTFAMLTVGVAGFGIYFLLIRE